MPEYTVQTVAERGGFEGQYGPMKTYKMLLNELPGELVEIVQKPETPEPTPGQKIDGTITDGQYGKRLKKTFTGGQGGGFQKDPETQKSIIRQHSQEMAVRTAAIAAANGKLEFTSTADLVDKIKTLTNVFESDATPPAAAPPAPVSDVPSAYEPGPVAVAAGEVPPF